MMVTWAGMIGAVSGMNNSGLTVTLNAGKSDMPLIAKTPISLLAREILQYANNIEEAILIAKKREVFVSESIMIGSAKDNRAVLIEVSPNNFGVYDVANSNQLICSNHFQSATYANDKNNKKQIQESHSLYRFEKMTELFKKHQVITPEIAVDILRDKSGLSNKKIGFGNEKALNQLLAHHGIVFKPAKKQVWISANPYQLGEFVCYDLNTIFSDSFKENQHFERIDLSIAKDNFIASTAFEKYEKYRSVDREIDTQLEMNAPTISTIELKKYIALNPELWSVYYKVGLIFENKGYLTKAKSYFEKALTKEITTVPDFNAVHKHLRKCSKKISNR